ncbi:MAG: phosphatase PAP2 family protein [Candidatus Sedimenticola sp. (ex Thyasira tokunagai)]
MTELINKLRLDLLICIALLLLFLLFPQIDLWVSNLFYLPESGFHLDKQPLIYGIYKVFADIHFFVFFGLLIFWLVKRLKGKEHQLSQRRKALFLLMVLAIGPGLIVNEVFKAHSERARPRDVVEFGGDKMFTPLLEFKDQCSRNCSFVSGHAGMGFFFISLAWVFRQRRWLVLGIVIGAVVGGGRIMQGAHFFSDVIFAFWVVYWTSLLIARWYLGIREIVPQKDSQLVTTRPKN